ncbi:MAG: right-handed parallel beta-helix repeat-containing protein [Candidatus Heimdallarchaeota archaeon]|nr:right-handed parallel beta-helix repeat-containing protein [Candidatus Heimdallarchaeota archaeon]MBY8994098.1 right-handed parallel beta-helix repeat-containing protein [Candidatus Heimdallarchaeota archaeon]
MWKRYRKSKSGKTRLKFIVLGIIILLILSLFVGALIWRYRNAVSQAGIIITSDADFTEKYNFPGSGTMLDPYRLENLQIDTDNEYGIQIRDVSSYFIIRNCFIKSTLTVIQLINIESNYTLIEGNLCVLSPSQKEGQYWYVCIDVYYARNIEIKDNICECSSSEFSDEVDGIIVISSYSVFVQNNTCNNLEQGIGVGFTKNNITINGNICNSNYKFGISVFFDDSYGSNASCFIANNTCVQNTRSGILVNLLSPSLITGNDCSFNQDCGIRIGVNFNATVMKNHLSNNTIGIQVSHQSYYSNISYNHIQHSYLYGISIDGESYFHMVHHNNLINNYYSNSSLFQQAYDNCNNTWYEPIRVEGNYWDNLIWFPGAIYIINGSTTIDPFPLEHPVII